MREARWQTDPKEVTVVLGQVAAEVGVEGLIAPSAVDKRGCNVVVFSENLDDGGTLLAQDVLGDR
jgi:hypothetical protein